MRGTVEQRFWAKVDKGGHCWEWRACLSDRDKQQSGEHRADSSQTSAVPPEASDRELLARWMTAHSFSTGHGDTLAELLKELEWQVKELRERNRIEP